MINGQARIGNKVQHNAKTCVMFPLHHNMLIILGFSDNILPIVGSQMFIVDEHMVWSEGQWESPTPPHSARFAEFHLQAQVT